MTRVNDNNDNREVQRREQERRSERLQRDKARSENQDFSRLVSQKQQKTAKANRDADQARGKDVAQQAAASSRLLARQGIKSSSFVQKLQQQGEQSLGQNQMEAKSRKQQFDESRRAGDERRSEGDKQKVDRQSDRLAAISRDDRGEGRQGKGQSSGGKDGFGAPAHAQSGAAAQAQATASAQAAQGAAPAYIPAAVIQQIVQRVLVGVNKEGLSELHLEFKDNVLAGSSLTLTADNGKISARFHTRDNNVRRLLKASEGELARAFGRKGLTLERLEVQGP